MFFDVYNNVKLGDHCAPNEVNTQAILAVMNDATPYQITVPYYLKVSMPDGPGVTCSMLQCCFEFLL